MDKFTLLARFGNVSLDELTRVQGEFVQMFSRYPDASRPNKINSPFPVTQDFEVGRKVVTKFLFYYLVFITVFLGRLFFVKVFMTLFLC